MQLLGIHHLTAITADAPANLAFYTGTLGLRLVKKTVNQDQTEAYHLYYADAVGSPGTDITFFDFPAPPEQRGSQSVVRTAFRVAGEASLRWWQTRLREQGAACGEIGRWDGRRCLDCEDPEGQRLSLVDDGGEPAPARVWPASPVPSQHQLRGLGPIALSVRDAAATARLLTGVLGMSHDRAYRWGEAAVSVYAMGDWGASAELHLVEEPHLPPGQQGSGGVHHVAFRVADADYQRWAEHLASVRLPNSGPVDRFYFRSLYFREPNGILLELASDGPGFDTDEPLEHLGEALALPPFLEPHRETIERRLKPL